MHASRYSTSAMSIPRRYVRRMRRMNLTGKNAGAAVPPSAGPEYPGIGNVSHSNLLSWAGTFGQGLTSLTKGTPPHPPPPKGRPGCPPQHTKNNFYTCLWEHWRLAWYLQSCSVLQISTYCACAVPAFDIWKARVCWRGKGGQKDCKRVCHKFQRVAIRESWPMRNIS